MNLLCAISQADRHTQGHQRAGVLQGQAHHHPQAELQQQTASAPPPLPLIRLLLPRQPEAELRAATQENKLPTPPPPPGGGGGGTDLTPKRGKQVLVFPTQATGSAMIVRKMPAPSLPLNHHLLE